MLLGSEKGEVMIVHNGDLRGSLSVEPEATIKAIVPTPKVPSSTPVSYLSTSEVMSDKAVAVVVSSELLAIR